ncbi:MAG: S41 family peptidase [Phycisphaerales bacterium]|nr:S41 family peptidase [Phycisphaerales bacterium]
MSIKRFIALTLLSGFAFNTQASNDTHNGLIQYPSLSPDARYIVFSAAGDLWSIPSDGGSATRLTSHPGIELQSRFNNDGSQLVFESNRDGTQNLYTMNLSESGDSLVGNNIERVTTSDRAEMLGGWSKDGKSVLFSAYLYPEIYRHPRMYSAPIDGGAMDRVTEAFGRGPATHSDSEDVFFIRGYYYPHRVAYRGPGNLDIWRFRPSDNSFMQVTKFSGNDLNPNQLPDGSLVYISSRDGQYNLVRLNPDATDQQSAQIKQLTHFKPNNENPTTISHGVRDLLVSQDGTTATFVVWNTLYTLDLTNSRATPRAVEVTINDDTSRDQIRRRDISKSVAQAAIHPSGNAVAEITRGELFIRSTEEGFPTQRVTKSATRERDIVWSPDGESLYFTSDDENSLGSIFAARVVLTKSDLVPDVVEEVDEVEEPDVVESEASDEMDEAEETVSDEMPEPSDEESDKSGDDDADEEEVEEDKVDFGQRWSDALRFEIVPVVQDAGLAFSPKPSPDGTKLMYLRDRGDIVIRDLRTGNERVVQNLWSEPDILWASDSSHIVYAATDLDFNSDIFLLDTQALHDGSFAQPVNISRHPDIDHAPQLSHDGKVLSFLSDRDNENWEFDVYSVNLDRELDGMRSYELSQYYKDAAATTKKLKPIDHVDFNADADDAEEVDSDRLEFDAQDAYLRIRRLTSTPQAESSLVMTPSGDRLAFSTVIDGSRNYVSVDYNGKDRKVVKSGGVGDPRISLDGKSLSYVASGQAYKTSPAGGKATGYPISAKIQVDQMDELEQKFNEASGRFGLNFYHPTMKGLDWDATSDRYRQLVMQSRTNQAFLRLMSLMWGEVDGSHTGTWGGDGFSSASPANGYLGINFSQVQSGYRIDSIIAGGPIDRTKNGPAVGDVITRVGDVDLVSQNTVSGLVDLHGSLAGTSGNELLVEFTTTNDDGESADQMAIITPNSYARMSVLRYEDEVTKRREQVDAMSDGKLGYLHIRSMGLASVRDYERDLFAAADGKEGLVIDVRDNGGGWTTDILLASLTAPNHAYTIPRGANPDKVRMDNYPRDRRLIYAYSRPISVLINQHSFSNAEIFAHSIRNTKRGTIVGTQTFGGVISTGSFQLIDGTTVRRPFRGWYLPDGTDMESNGTLPDIDVPQTPMDEVEGRDPQLEAAVNELLGRTGN